MRSSATQMASQPSVRPTVSLSTSTATPLTLQNGFPIVASQNITNTIAIDPDYKLAYAQTWNIAAPKFPAAWAAGRA